MNAQSPSPPGHAPLTEDDVGGVHVKYLHHCHRQLWLYTRGYRPEAGSDLVAYGEAIDATTFGRKRGVALDALRIDWVDGRSVFEGQLTPAQLRQLRADLKSVLDGLDSVIVYIVDGPATLTREVWGHEYGNIDSIL